jgi:hypothetical protein
MIDQSSMYIYVYIIVSGVGYLLHQQFCEGEEVQVCQQELPSHWSNVSLLLLHQRKPKTKNEAAVGR